MTDAKTLLSRYQPKDRKPIPQDRQLCTVRFSPCGKFLAAGDFEGRVCRWESSAEGLTPQSALSGHNGWVQRIAFHPDGKRLYSADSWGELRCWPIQEAEPRATWSVRAAHQSWIRGLAVSPDGQWLATCGRDGFIRCWNPATGARKQEWAEPGADLFCVAFSPDSRSLVHGDLHGVVKQRDLASGKVLRQFDARVMYLYERIQDVGGVRCLAFEKTGATLAVGGGQPSSGGFVQGTALVLFFETATGKLVQELKIGTNNDGFVHDGAWHRDGFFIGVSSGQPGQGKMFFHQPGAPAPFFLTPKMANCHGLAIHPDGHRLVVSATNASSAGNGRLLNKDKEYPGNSSPLFIWDLPKT